MEEMKHRGESNKVSAYLHQRGNVYYFKRKYPLEVAVKLEKKPGSDAWKSLRTRDRDEALERLCAANEDFIRTCQAATPDIPRLPGEEELKHGYRRKYLSIGLVNQVANRYAYLALKEVDEMRTRASIDELRDELNYYRDCLEVRKNDNATRNFDAMAETAMAVLSGEKMVATPNSDAWRRLLETLIAKDIEVLEESIARLQGTSTDQSATEPIPVREAPTIVDAFQSWRAQFCAARGLPAKGESQITKKTEDTYAHFVQVFVAVCGELVLSDISDGHVTTLVRYLAEEEELKRKTVKNYLGGLATVMRSMTSQERVEAAAGPKTVARLNAFDFADLRDVTETPESELRRALTDEELAYLFAELKKKFGATWSSRQSNLADKFWLCPVMTYTGCRLEEYAQMRVDNVVQRQGCWGIEFASLRKGQTAKTKNSHRFIPLHESLISMGFLRFWEEARQSGHVRLFPNVSNNNKYRRYGPALGKWFGNLCEEIGLSDAGISTYSMRRNFAQRLQRLGVNQMAIDALMGHWLTKSAWKSTSFYYREGEGQLPLDTLRRAIATLDYPELRGNTSPATYMTDVRRKCAE